MLNERIDIIRRLARKEAPSLGRALEKTRAPDIAEAISYSAPHVQRFIWEKLTKDDNRAADVLSCIEEDSLPEFVRYIDFDQLVRLLQIMELDDEADIIETLPKELQIRILEALKEDDRTQVEDILAYPNGSAGGLMHVDVVRINENKTCRDAIKLLQSCENVEMAFYLYIETDNHQLTGVLSLRRLLIHPPSTALKTIMITDLVTVSPMTEEEEVANIVQRYDIIALPVVDENRTLLGIITVDDVVDVIWEAHENQMMKMAGMADEYNPNEKNVWRAFKQRLTWLLITLFGGMGMAELIGVFEPTLSAEATLASFIPVMLGTGGNVGTQAATIAVRNLAVDKAAVISSFSMLFREAKVGILLGLSFGVILGGYAYFRFKPLLGLAIFISTLSTVFCAALLGMMVPITLHRLKIDPAVATGPFVTTAIDLIAILIYFSTCVAILQL
jgi:magnesium transporter